MSPLASCWIFFPLSPHHFDGCAPFTLCCKMPGAPATFIAAVIPSRLRCWSCQLSLAISRTPCQHCTRWDALSYNWASFFATIGLFIHVTNERPNEFCHPRFGLQTGRRNWHIHQTYRVSYKSPEQINLALSRLTVYEWITTAMLKNDFLEDVGYNEINDAFISCCKNEDIQQRSTNTNHCYYSIQSNPIQLDLNPVGLRNTK